MKTLIRFLLDPSLWSKKHLILLASAFLTINLFSSRGLIQLLLLHQEDQRLESAINTLKKENLIVSEEIALFQKSNTYKRRKIQHQLGLLGPKELSFEFSPHFTPQTETLISKEAQHEKPASIAR